VQALGLRASGATYRQIADVLKIDKMTAWRLVTEESANAIQETAREILELELTRLDQLQMGLWAKAINGDVQAVIAVLRIMDMRAKLLGLYDRAAEARQLQRGTDVEGVVVIQGEASEDEYIAALRAMRGELALPPSNGNGQAGS
jgi:hypothetical protein